MSTETDVPKESVSLWRFLKSHAGMDSIFYDKELLEGKPGFPETGLYSKLGIAPSELSFEETLIKEKVTVEKLLICLLETVQPYAQMMSDICAFFEHHGANQSDQHMSIEFDFDQADGANLSFDLRHFRELMASLQKVKRSANRYIYNSNTLWPLINAFDLDNRIQTRNPTLRKWIDDYEKEVSPFYGDTNLAFPKSSNTALERQIERALRIWKNFVHTCSSISLYREEFENTIRNEKGIDSINTRLSLKTKPWDPGELLSMERDRWPVTFLNRVFGKLELMAEWPSDQREAEEEIITKAVSALLDNGVEEPLEEDELLNELTSLLKLPVWRQRHALYGAWILALLDKALVQYPRTLHHENGKLSLPFKATRILTITTVDGPVELWSEVKSPVEEPEGKSRKYHIQPDYSIYNGNNPEPRYCLAVVEVKQYRKSSNANFAAALNDYCKALNSAHVFLVNYGSVGDSLANQLTYPERSHFYGEIIPDGLNIDSFLQALLKVLPGIPIGTDPITYNVEEWKKLLSFPLDNLCIDISGSLNHPAYKAFVQQIFKDIFLHHPPQILLALDQGIRQYWEHPSVEDIKALTNLGFEKGTDFAKELPKKGINLVITDPDGLQELKDQKGIYVILYSENSPITLHRIE